MNPPTIRCIFLGLSLSPLMAGAQSATSHRPATAPQTHHPVEHVSHCPVPAPQLSPKIPPTSITLGCPKVEYALTYLDTKVGTGELAQPHKWYTVAYTGYLPDGTKIDSSYDHPDHQPITFPYGAHRVILGWDTGFEGMHIGGKRRLFVPYQLAYGEMGRPPVIPPKSELIFDVELISQSETPPPPPAMPGQTPRPGAAPGGATPPPSSTPPAGQANPQSAPTAPPQTPQPQTHPTPAPTQPQTTPPTGNPPGSTQPQ